MSSDIFTNFSALDELVQIIYQSIYKFVVVSFVKDDSWTIYLGLSESDGRWWKGSWKEEDLHGVVGSKASDTIIERFADQLAKLFVEGELYISGWSTKPGAQIKFTVGPTAKRPMHVPLEELSPSEAAEFATGILVDIALQAKSRKCRLHGSAEPEPSIAYQAKYSSPSAIGSRPSVTAHGQKSSSSSSRPDPDDVLVPNPVKPSHLVEVETVARQLGGTKSQAVAGGSDKKRPAAEKPKAPPGPAPKARKGASIANPNKKARKYEAIEFGSDSE